MNNLKSRIEDRLIDTFVVVFLSLFVIITLYPVLNTVAISFNDGIDAIRGGIYLWPRRFSMKNYQTVMGMQNLMIGAKITVLRTLLGTLSALAVNALLAFVVSRKRFFVQIAAVIVLGNYHVRKRRFDSGILAVPQPSLNWYFLGLHHSWYGQCMEHACYANFHAWYSRQS